MAGHFQKSQVRQMTDAEAAWVGAMIEAEGSVVFHPTTSAHIAKVTVVNTDPEIISALLRATGAGTVHHSPARTSLGKKLVYVWWMSKWNEVKDLVAQTGQYSMKLQRIEV